MLDPTVMPGKLENEIIHRASEVVANFSNENRDAHRSLHDWGGECAEIMRGIRVEINSKSVLLLDDQDLKPGFQIIKVFFRPVDAVQRAFDGMSGHV